MRFEKNHGTKDKGASVISLAYTLLLLQLLLCFQMQMTIFATVFLATRQTDVSTSAIQIPTTTPPPIIPNRREIRDWLIVDRQIGSFYEVQVQSELLQRKIDWKLLYMCQSA